jgi:hypothetical protein
MPNRARTFLMTGPKARHATALPRVGDCIGFVGRELSCADVGMGGLRQQGEGRRAGTVGGERA